MRLPFSPLQQRGYQPPSSPKPEDDFGSPFDVAYGVDDDAVGWLPQPLATSAALPPEPDTTPGPAIRTLTVVLVIAGAAALALLLSSLSA